MSSGWKNERERHALARNGVKTKEMNKEQVHELMFSKILTKLDYRFNMDYDYWERGRIEFTEWGGVMFEFSMENPLIKLYGDESTNPTV